MNTHYSIIPQKHSHMPTLPIRWTGEVSVVHPGFVLDRDGDPIISLTPLAKIIALKVKGLLGESVSERKRKHDSEDKRRKNIHVHVRDIVNGIDEIERIDDSCLHVIRDSRLLRRVLRIGEAEIRRCLICSTIRIAFIA